MALLYPCYVELSGEVTFPIFDTAIFNSNDYCPYNGQVWAALGTKRKNLSFLAIFFLFLPFVKEKKSF